MEYRILGIEMARAGVKTLGPQAQRLTQLDQPPLDWVHLAKGMGVPAVRVETAGDLVQDLERALAEEGPHVIEAMV